MEALVDLDQRHRLSGGKLRPEREAGAQQVRVRDEILHQVHKGLYRQPRAREGILDGGRRRDDGDRRRTRQEHGAPDHAQRKEHTRELGGPRRVHTQGHTPDRRAEGRVLQPHRQGEARRTRGQAQEVPVVPAHEGDHLPKAQDREVQLLPAPQGHDQGHGPHHGGGQHLHPRSDGAQGHGLRRRDTDARTVPRLQLRSGIHRKGPQPQRTADPRADGEDPPGQLPPGDRIFEDRGDPEGRPVLHDISRAGTVLPPPRKPRPRDLRPDKAVRAVQGGAGSHILVA